MKFIAFTLLSLVGLSSAEQHFTVGLKVGVEGIVGNPNNAKCTSAIESTFVAAYAATYPGSDVHLDSVTFTDVSPGLYDSKENLQVGTMGYYSYAGSADNSCRRCNPALSSANFSTKDDLLKAVGTTDAFEAKLLSMLQALDSSECNAFKTITDVNVEWIRDTNRMENLHLAYGEPVEHYAVVKADEQHFTVGLKVGVEGIVGNPNNAKCTSAIQDTFVAAYASAYPNSDVHVNSVTFTSVTPSSIMTKMLRVATQGYYSYAGSADNSCRRCNPALSATFFGKDELLEAVGTTDAFEAKLLSMLQALDSSDCNAFKKVSDVNVEWIRGGTEELV